MSGRTDSRGKWPVARDYYSILGVTPTSEDVVIRAAYRALMRRYHPDADPSGEAAERAQAINAAYAVLSDPEKRARYDGSLAAQGLIKAEPSSKRRRSRSRRFVPGPAAFVGLATLATAAAVIYIAPPIGVRPPDTVDPVGTPRPHTAAVAGEQADAAPDAAALCDNVAVSSLLKTELLRRAASVAGADEEALERAGEAAVVRLNSASSREGGRVAAGCSAFVTIDLPPGTAVEGGRTNLNSELTYGVARAGKGTLRLAGLSGDRRLVRSLATLAPFHPEQPADVDLIPPSHVAAAAPARPARASEKVQPKPVAVASARPVRAPAAEATPAASAKTVSSCRLGNGWAEQTICNSSNLTALDRQLGLLYGQSWTRADEQKRAVLSTSRDRFQDKRSACRSEACLTNVYVARLREISDIMARRSDQ